MNTIHIIITIIINGNCIIIDAYNTKQFGTVSNNTWKCQGKSSILKNKLNSIYIYNSNYHL